MAVSLLRDLRNKLSSGSFSLRNSTQKDVSLSPDDEVMDAQLKAIVKAFKLRSFAELKVILSALILSECVYKLVDVGEQESAKAASGFMAQFPPGLVSLQHVQSANTTVPHRYMLGDDGQSLYVVFMGTKHMRDLLSDANFLQEAVWKDPDKQQQAGALAHRGFLARARHVPVEALYAHARSQGKRLILCGHSLGGAVALLCTLRLLQGLAGSTPSLQCICFGTPAIGNAALAAVVAEYGWESHILNFILPEDIIPRMLALPAVPKPEKALPPALDANSQQDTTLQAQAAKSASDPAVGAGAVRSRLQNLRAILTARKADTQQADAFLTQPAPQQVRRDATAKSSSSTPPSVPTADATQVQGTAQAAAQAGSNTCEGSRAEAASTSVLSPEGSPRPVLPSLRSIASRLPLGPLQTGALRDVHAHSSTDSTPANGSQEELQPLDSQTSEAKQGPRMWGLQSRVQGVWLGASNRAKALRSLLPAYPAYVHIGSHQILLPASPAMSKALKDAQQQGLAEERQQALIMHRMSAYRGRAIAICRSVFHWASADTSPQISLSSTLAPPITLIHSCVIVPPLPTPGILSTNQAEQSSQTANPAILAKQQASLPQSPIPRKAASVTQVAGDPIQQQHLPHSPVLATAKHAVPVPSMVKSAAPVGQQGVQPAPVQTHSGQPSTVQPEPYTQEQQAHSPAAQRITASVQSQAVASPKRWCWQRSSTSSQQAPALGIDSAAGMQGSAQGFLGQMPEPEVTSQAQHQAPAVDQTEPSRSAVGGITEARPSRWLLPVGVRWQGSKQKPPPKAVVRICVQGNVHSMPVRAQLQVMGQTWCKARLLPSGPVQHRAPRPDAPMEHQSGEISWRQLLMQRLPWLQLQPVERQHAQQGVLCFQAEVPVALLHAIIDDQAQQLRHQQQQNWDEKHPSSQALQAPQQLEIESPTEQPAMLLRLQTDFQTREQAVQVQLPVVWLLGTDPAASQAIWQTLTAAQQPPKQTSTAHSNLPEDGKAGSAWQSAQQKFRQALSMVRRQEASGQLQQPQPQLETAIMSGVCYAHIQATRMQAVDMLSCLLMLLIQFTRDSVAAGPMPLEGSLQRLPARLRAVYHRQELQSLQSRLLDLGPPSGVLLAHGGSVELKLSHAIGLMMKQANVMGITRLGITLSRGVHIGSEGLFSIPSDDWVELPHQTGGARAETHVVGLQQRLRTSLTAAVSGLSPRVSKL